MRLEILAGKTNAGKIGAEKTSAGKIGSGKTSAGKTSSLNYAVLKFLYL
jgi:hypothetical protein